MRISIDKDRLNEVIEKMCDDYCVWPTTCPTQERLDMHCKECPLNNIEYSEYPLGYCPHQE